MKILSGVANLILFGMVLSAGALAAPAGDDGFDLRNGFAHVAQRAIPAVVFIQVEKQVSPGANFSFSPEDLFGQDFMERFFGRRLPTQPRGGERRQRPFTQTGQGSGFIITKDGYILTNTHVIDGADKITVRLNDGKEYLAKRIGADDRTEVAVIKIEAKDLPTVELGDASKLRIGEWVVAIGNPFGLSETLTVGVVSALGRKNMGITDYEDFIQTDAAINPGNSGGPLLNIDGRVIGINTAIFSRSGGYMGIGFAVPIDMAVAVKEQLIAHGKVTRGYLGIAMNPGEVDEDVARSFGLDSAGGVLIADVMPDGAAAKAGLKAGDIIRELNGQKVSDSASFRAAIARIQPGTVIELGIYRDGKKQTIKAKLDAVPEKPGQPASSGEGEEDALDEEMASVIGVEVANADAAELQRWGYEGRNHGVVITEVLTGSPAEHEGLRPGFLIIGVNQRQVEKVGDLAAALKAAKGEKIIRLRVQSPDGTRYAFIKPEWE
ncbi:MAG: Do family serine endopeptidase [Kiritimatiellae bacterium]|nr:Do family serine endopeptidase [Kiritimatiellia bacterium]